MKNNTKVWKNDDGSRYWRFFDGIFTLWKVDKKVKYTEGRYKVIAKFKAKK